MSAAVGVAGALGERYRTNRDAAGKMHDMKVGAWEGGVMEMGI
jgi:hypothetical protein